MDSNTNNMSMQLNLLNDKIKKIPIVMLCFGDTHSQIIIDSSFFILISILIEDKETDDVIVVCIHSGECVSQPIVVIPPPYISNEDVEFASTLLRNNDWIQQDLEDLQLVKTIPVNYTDVLCLLNYLGTHTIITDKLFTHVHKLAGETNDVSVCYEINKLFKSNLQKGVVKTVDYINMYPPSMDPINYWNILIKKPWSWVLDLILQLNPSLIVISRNNEYKRINTDAASYLNIPIEIINLVNINNKLVTIAGGAALALLYTHRKKLLLPSSDVDIFFFKEANQNSVLLKIFIKCLRNYDYVVCRSRESVLTAVHATFRTVQLIGCDVTTGTELINTFDFCNVQIYYDGYRCYETIQSLQANSRMMIVFAPGVNIVTSSARRLQKMFLKGFSNNDVNIQRYIDATTVADKYIDLEYDYPILVNNNIRIRDNILNKFGLVPINESEVLEPLTSVPTYQKNQIGQWVDNHTKDSIDRLLTFVKTRIVRNNLNSYRIHTVSSLNIDLGFGTLPKYTTDNNHSVETKEKDALNIIVNVFNKLVITESANYDRLCYLQSCIITKVSELSNVKFVSTHDHVNNYRDINVKVTKDTVFYFYGKRLEKLSEILSMLICNKYIYRVYSDYSFLFENMEGVMANTQSFKFVLNKVIITNRPGAFNI